MTGGLLQMISSGKQDIYLTIKPEITFFKKVFRRYTNFATELIRIKSDQDTEYNNINTFTINIGDCIGRCYLEIDLPNLYFSDKYITNTNYINYKQAQINNTNTMITKWSNYYNNLKGYVDIELQLYRQLMSLLQSVNITINGLKDSTNRFNIANKTGKDNYKNKIDPTVYSKINMTGYINSIDRMVTSVVPNPNPTIYITIDEITLQLDAMYKNMIRYLTYYNNKVCYFQDRLSILTSPNQINFNYAEYLGHNFFENFVLEIGGQEITRYTNEILHINQMHSIKEDYMKNYKEMIGMIPELTTFTTTPKGNYKLLVPTIFWFNKDTGSSLPLVALQYSTVKISVKINPKNKIVCFQNFELMFDKIVTITIDAMNGYYIDKKLIYRNYTIDSINMVINYKCILINEELLRIVFPDLTANEINILLTSAGTMYTWNEITKIVHPELTMEQIQTMNGPSGLTTQYTINKNQWVAFMINITDPSYNTLAPKVGSYYPYIDYNVYYGMVPNPTISMVCETVYLDDVERAKFANSKLEYVVENFDENIYKIPYQNTFDCELSFINPCKELLWFYQPQIFIDGLTQYGQNISLQYDMIKYFKNELVTKHKLMFNSYDVLMENINNFFYTYTLSNKLLNNVLPSGVYYNAFCLSPENTQPSGTVNLTEIKGKQYQVTFNPTFLAEYKEFLKKLYGSNTNLINSKLSITLRFISKNYDLFIVNKGAAKLLFSI
jgi:hypothetical protein